MGQVLFDVNVTQEDIDEGQRQSRTQCALARAVARAVPECRSIQINTEKRYIGYTVRENGVNIIRQYAMNDRTLDFARLWDLGEAVRPWRLRVTDSMLIVRRAGRVRKAEDMGKRAVAKRIKDESRVVKHRIIRPI